MVAAPTNLDALRLSRLLLIFLLITLMPMDHLKKLTTTVAFVILIYKTGKGILACLKLFYKDLL